MPSKPDLLLIGRLFGAPETRVDELFQVHRIEDFAPVPEFAAEMAGKFRAVAVGMVGSGHIDSVVVNEAFLARFPRLELVAALGVGCDHIDVVAAAARDVIVTNTPDVNTEEVADTAMGMLLSTVRQLPQADRFIRSGAWPTAMFPLTGTLRNKRLGILGLGRIGKAVARRAEGFDLEILYHNRNRREDVPYTYVSSALELARAVDILMLIVPGGEDTRDLVDAEMLRALGPDGVLLNVSRGTVVNESALIEALKNKVIAGAGLDAFLHEPHVPDALIEMEHVVLLPHIGSGTHHTREQMSVAVVNNLEHWNAGRPPPNPVRPGQQT
ncbi:MAG: 2-hydroxyacid dehydrogenase [Alphaproteobacteria bacterium]|jgi:lactate dehydrogenase-like 2-hydroxyacid dehydrogenase|nr:2-hydroxyacid dehydrogenase [Alphaproteobacteria bacterium]